MHLLLALLVALLLSPWARAEEPKLAGKATASLIFRADEKPADQQGGYPHLLKVFLRLENISDGDLSWAMKPGSAIEAELLDEAGKEVRQAPGASSITTALEAALILPYGSRLDWLVSHGGISMSGDRENAYALVVGGKGWLVPRGDLGKYSLRLRLRGLPGHKDLPAVLGQTEMPILVEVPATKLAAIP